MTRRATSDMSSSGFVSYAIEVARSAVSWDAAERAFCGRARWEPPAPEREPSTSTQTDVENEPQPA